MPSLTLEILQGDEPRSVTYDLEQTKKDKVIRIGRNADDCDLILKDRKVSRLHAEIFFKEDEATFYLQNLTAKRPNAKPNPVWVNNSSVIDGEIALSMENQIKLGQVLLKIVAINIPQNGIKCVNGHTVPYTYQGYFCPHCGTFLESGNTVVVSSSQFGNLGGDNASRN